MDQWVNNASAATQKLRETMNKVGIQRDALNAVKTITDKLAAAKQRAQDLEAAAAKIAPHVKKSAELTRVFGQQIKQTQDAGRGIAVQMQRVQAELSQATARSQAQASALSTVENRLGRTTALAASYHDKLAAAQQAIHNQQGTLRKARFPIP